MLFEHVTVLASDEFSGRKVATAGSILAQEYIVNQLEKVGVVPYNQYFRQNFEYKTRSQHSVIGTNIVGVVRGATHSDKYIILSAHYDHIGSRGTQVYNGADDNASGTASLLSLAQSLVKTPLNYNVILLFTDAEEANLKGAYAFIEQNNNVVENTILNINMDMIGGIDSTRTLHYLPKKLRTILNEKQFTDFIALTKSSPIRLKKGFHQFGAVGTKQHKRRWNKSSDHAAFAKESIPYIYYGVGTHKHYHQFTDNVDNFNFSFLLLSTQTIYQHLRFLDQHIKQSAS